MTSPKDIKECAFDLLRAKNRYMNSQNATLDLVALSETEAAKLDERQYRARRLAETLGIADLDPNAALELYDAVIGFMNVADPRRKKMAQPEPAVEEDPQRLDAASDNAENGHQRTESRSAETESASAEDDDAFLAFKKFRDTLKKHGLPDNALSPAMRTAVNLNSERSRSALLLESLFISSISQFEAFISTMASASLRVDPRPLQKSDRKFKYSDIANLSDIDTFIEVAIDAFVDALMWESAPSWLKFLNTATQSDTEWMLKEIEEPILRRHVHVHAEGRVSPQYLDTLTNRPKNLSVGDKLPITREYFEDVLDRLALVVLCLTQSALMALSKSKPAQGLEWEQFDSELIQSSFDLLSAGRNSAVAPLYDKVERSIKFSSTREHVRANSYQAKKAVHGLEKIRDNVSNWDVSSLSDRIILVKYCLLEDMQAAEKTFKRLQAANDLGMLELATWPILEPLRKHMGTESDTSDT